jgi:hypothetical protein
VGEDAEKRVDRESRPFELSGREVVELATGFRLYGFWRMELDSGHVFATENFFRIYGMEWHDGPVDIVEVSSMVHPDDLIGLMQTFENAGIETPTYHNIFRVRLNAGAYKFVRSVGKYRAKAGTSGEVVGISYELSDHA